MPEEDSNGIILKMRSQGSPERLIPASQFQIMFRLRQIYLVDIISKMIGYLLDFHKSWQDQIFGGQQNEQNDNANNIEDQANTPKKPFLSQSLHGSRRHLLSLAHKALCLVSEYGRPALFFTLTYNPYWKDIKDMLLESETAHDRADITNKVFQSKLELFHFNLWKGKYFGPHSTKSFMRYELSNISREAYHMLTLLFNYLTFLTIKFICWIDENINCTFILFSDINENSDERTRQKHELIKSHMIPSAIKDART